MLVAITKSKSEQKRIATLMESYKKHQAKTDADKAPSLRELDPSLPFCVIIDVDGTLAYRGDRGIFDFKKSVDDEVVVPVRWIVQSIDSLCPNIEIVILTAREEMFREYTVEFLKKNDIPHDKLLMRRTGDKRPGEIIKSEIYAGHIRNKYNVFFAIDDYSKVTDMWKSLGIYTFAVSSGEPQRK